MKKTRRFFLVLFAILGTGVPFASAQNIAFGPDPDPNFGPANSWGITEIFNQGIYAADDQAVEPNGNQMLKASTGQLGTGGDQFGWVTHLSNGENGNDGDDPDNPDTPNTEPADPIWSNIGNTSGRMEVGNTIRVSMWMRQDPTDPIITAPAIEPILKLELWTEALSNNADFTTAANPGFGDRLYDTDQNGFVPFATYVDSNNDGTSSDPFGGPGVPLTTSGWTLVSTQYEVDDSSWGYALGTGFVSKTVSDVEELRPVLFTGDFSSTDLTMGGSLLVDNPMVEIYRTLGDLPGTIPNPEPTAPEISVVVDRDSGKITITNLSGSSSELVGYTITSVAGGIDADEWLSIAENYDAGSSGPDQVDPINNWTELTETNLELAEASDAANSGAAIDPSDTVDLGDAWLRTPFEDINFSFTLADGTTGSGSALYSGNGGAAYARSDLNADGVIDPQDWDLFYPNTLSDMSALSLAEAYLVGDLDGDLDNDFVDFRLFKEDFIAAQGAAAWNAMVPEPSSLALLGLGLLGFGLRRRQSLAKFAIIAVLAACVITVLPADSHAQTAFTIDPNATWAGYMNVFDTPADGGGFQFGSNWTTTDLRAEFNVGPSQPLTLSPNTNTYDDNLTDPYWVDQTTMLGNKDMNANFYQEVDGLDGQLISFDYDVVANTLPAGYSAVGFIKVLDAASNWATVQEESFDLSVGSYSLSLQEDGTAVDPRVQAGFTVMGLNVSSLDPVALTGVTITDGSALDQLTMEVDTTNGPVRLQNNTSSDINIDWYELNSPAGALNRMGWESLDNQEFDSDGWNEAGGSNDSQLAELFLGAAGSTLAAGFDMSIGNAFDPSEFGPGNDGDLEFKFAVADGGLLTGIVEYVTSMVNCDFNGDLACDIDDLNAMLAEGPIKDGVAVTPGVNEEFDLSGDGVIDNTDRDLWLASAATENGFASPYLVGDANLDGFVDVSDFNIWNGGKFENTLAWNSGDFNGDGVADVSDFNVWNGNKFQSSGISAVPEPTGAVIALCLLCGCWGACRRR